MTVGYKTAGAWALSVGMPVAVLLWTLIWNGWQVDAPVQTTAAYIFLWAAQYAMWSWPAVQACTVLLFLQTFLQLFFRYDVTLPTLWPTFVACGNVWGLFLSGLFYKYGSRPGATIQDWYSGIDLHPMYRGVDVKLFIASRIGMMSWALAVMHALCDWVKADSLPPISVFVVSALQLLYILRFFTWEKEYLLTMDQQHDRAGFYICWGCMAYIPALYWLSAVLSSPGMFESGVAMSRNASLFFGILGVASIYGVSLIDEQKTRVRANPHCFVAGRPATYIKTKKETLLLTCGAWGTARHLHYLFELCAAVCWTAPVAGTCVWGYAYCAYLAILLVNRVYRDDDRCREKYGVDWEEYCRQVPYKIIPGVF